jgi:hypothetical protein
MLVDVFSTTFIARQAMFDQPELKPHSIDANRSSRALTTPIGE